MTSEIIKIDAKTERKARRYENDSIESKIHYLNDKSMGWRLADMMTTRNGTKEYGRMVTNMTRILYGIPQSLKSPK